MVIYENDTTNSSVLVPDAAGVYSLELPQTGNYRVLVLTQPMMNIPIIGKILFPGSSNTIIIHRSYAVPYQFMGICCVVICVAAGGGVIWKKTHRKRKQY